VVILDVLNFLKIRCVEINQADADAKDNHINFAIIAPVDFRIPLMPRIEFESDTMETVIRRVAQETGMTLVVGEYVVEFRAKDFPPIPPKAPSHGKAIRTAATIIIPRIDVENVTLDETIEYLNQRISGLSEGRDLPSIVYAPGADLDVKIRKLNLRNVPLPEVLRLIADLTGHQLESNDYGLRLFK